MVAGLIESPYTDNDSSIRSNDYKLQMSAEHIKVSP